MGGPDEMEEVEDDEAAMEEAKKGLMTSRQRKMLHRIDESRRHKRARVEKLVRRKQALGGK